MSIRVVIVDDHRVFREGLRAVLDGRDEVEIVGDFGDAHSALGALDGLRPDVVLMDLHLPGASGIAATLRIHDSWPEMAVLVLSMLDDRASVQAAIDAGARGYLVKSSGLEDIIRGVHAVHSGQFLLGPTAHAQLLHTGRQEPAAFRSHRSEFTAREEQILDLLATGATTGHIADRLDISSKTVRNYLSILYAKLGVEDRGQAALAARALRDTRNDR